MWWKNDAASSKTDSYDNIVMEFIVLNAIVTNI